ncbi:TPA: type II toxin-antitoxin system YafO family toxin [Yersinia enterocolitica]|nr:type II toxin-antitoxin system YafO family toxin [Yersinia enterocolitica]HDL8339244.1 type II toxin-antitoxin system YafO family toxin [Yersinia enterocolitica]HDL8343147.1 type II toxin-antitoxin system YafO family toxin [Yersinia enterocolitica]HDL8346939.1 type II toxin-antitoxin system YafO family toxin [Yersinia enterocolitica]HDL8352079.1 type II toxin-antitoxin system YafO family toxin [Yersinia enterocolitica]
MITVSAHPKVEHLEIAALYVQALEQWNNGTMEQWNNGTMEQWKNGGPLPPEFGSEGQWEDNRKLCDSFVYKIHIHLPDDPPWPPRLAVASRKSDNYLVYARHWLDPNKYQLISIMSPEAHALARTSYLAELERRAEEFQNT